MLPVTNTDDNAVRFLTAEGRLEPTAAAEEYAPFLDRLTEEDHRTFYRDMVFTRAVDSEGTNLQRQGQLALWAPSLGQEAAQVGSGRAARAQDTIFPSYREHAVAMIRGVDPLGLLSVMREVSLGGWDPTDPANGNFRIYTLVLGTQTLHASGYAMGVGFRGECGTGDPETDKAVMVYFGDGATSEGDVNEAMIFAASYRAPQVFFLQNNHWAISVPVSRQSRTPLYKRAAGFGLDSVLLDGNDVLASYAVSAAHLDRARGGGGPQYIEALTYRMGPHTTSDDPTKYRTPDEMGEWEKRDPVARFESWLRTEGADDAFFAETAEQARDYASDVRRRLLELPDPKPEQMFEHVYTDRHPLMTEQAEQLAAYEASLEGGDPQ